MKDHDRWQRIKELWAGALEQPPEEREAWLKERCRGEPALEQRVRRLLVADSEIGTFLETPALCLGGDPELTVRTPVSYVGHRVGVWTVIRMIGHGGMGTVYQVERTHGGFSQRGALKLIRPTRPSSELAMRFIRERQILAELEHPLIARLLDGGATDDGAPYLVMEYVDGRPIDSYCDERRLTVGQRLTLVARVCAAVQHAHRHLVVHRDLKPTNILVTAEGEPKLLDFGIADLLDEDSRNVGAGLVRRLTPDYASPEQLEGRNTTTASDVYSLGVLLYELLTGRLPHESEARSLRELATSRKTRRPTPPSQVVLAPETSYPSRRPVASAEEHAARRCASPRQLHRRLRGDLDAIVAKALETAPEARYPSVEALVADLELERRKLPVSARDDTFGYRVAKLLRRHAAVAAATVLVFSSLVAAALVSRQQARAAEAARLEAEQVNTMLEKILWSPNSSYYAGGGRADVTVVEILEKAADWLSRDLARAPAVEARLQYSIGTTLAVVGHYSSAEKALRRSFELHRRVYGDQHPETAKALSALGGQLFYSGDFAEAERCFRRVLGICRQTSECRDREDHLEVGATWALGYTLLETGRLGDALEQEVEALRLQQSLDGSSEILTGRILTVLGLTHAALGDLDRAERLIRLAAEVPGARIHALHRLGALLQLRGHVDEALGVLREAATLAEEDGSRPHLTLAIDRELALNALLRGEPAVAEETIRSVIARTRAIRGPSDHLLAAAQAVLGRLLVAERRPTEAEPVLRAALATYRRLLPERAHEMGELTSLLGASLAQRSLVDEGRELAAEGYEVLEAAFGREDPRSRAAAARLRAVDDGCEPACY